MAVGSTVCEWRGNLSCNNYYRRAELANLRPTFPTPHPLPLQVLSDLLATRNIASAAAFLSPPLAFDAAGARLCATATADDPAGCDLVEQPTTTTPPPTILVQAVEVAGEGFSPGVVAGVVAGTALLLAVLAALAVVLAPRSRLLRAALACIYKRQTRASKPVRRRRHTSVPDRLKLELSADHHAGGGGGPSVSLPELHTLPAISNISTLAGGRAGREAPKPFWSVQRVELAFDVTQSAGSAGARAAAMITTASQNAASDVNATARSSRGGGFGGGGYVVAMNDATTADLTLQLADLAASADQADDAQASYGLPRHLVPFLVQHAAAAAAVASTSATLQQADASTPSPHMSPFPQRFINRPAERARTCPPPAAAHQHSTSEPPLGSATVAFPTNGGVGGDAAKKHRLWGGARRGPTPRDVLAARALHWSPQPMARPVPPIAVATTGPFSTTSASVVLAQPAPFGGRPTFLASPATKDGAGGTDGAEHGGGGGSTWDVAMADLVLVGGPGQTKAPKLRLIAGPVPDDPGHHSPL